MGIDQLEPRTLLSGATNVGPLPLPQETLDVQLLPGSVADLSQISPLIAAAGATVQATTISGLYEVQGPAASMTGLAEELSSNPGVQYADSSRTVGDLAIPNDPYFSNGEQWQLNGTWGINVPGAWTVTTGSDKVIVADTDTGVDYKLTDLYDNVWINQAEIPASVLPNLKDVYNDGVITFTDLNNSINQGPGKITATNGVVDGSNVLAPTSSGGWADGSTQDGDTENPDDLIGWNFSAVSATAPYGTNNPIDQNGHGTFTAGEIAEVGNNGLDGTGVDWNVQLMPVQFLDSSGSGSDVAAAEAIDYAVQHGAKVINASWGGTGSDPTIADAIQYADENGVIIVCAAGNSTTDDDNSSTWFSPASYSSEYSNVISVAATESNGTLANFSNYGVGTVQLAAPGLNVNSLTTSGFGSDSGTSMAAPLVTGTIALVEAAHPAWSMSQVIDAVLDTTTPDPSLVGKVTTGGIVNAAAAVANTDGPYVVSATPDGSIAGSAGFSSVQLDFNEEINPATFTASEISVAGPGGPVAGVTVAAVAGSNDHEFTISFAKQSSAGTYTVKVGPDIQDWYGNEMNQSRNGGNGEAADAFVETIRQTATGSTDILSVTGIPETFTAGSSETFTVTALTPSGGTDTGFLGTINFSSSDPQAVLPASYTFTAANAGSHTFTVAFKTAGPQSITATDPANSAIIGTEDNLIVQAAGAQSLKVTGFPTPDTAGTSQSFRVTAYDAYGNVATGYTGTLEFTSSDGKAKLPAEYTVTPEDYGTFTFSATLVTEGSQSVTARDTSTSTLAGTESSILVQAAALNSLVVTGFPGSDTAGAAGDVTVAAYDIYGNLATDYTGTVSLTSTDPRAVLPAAYPFTAADAGKHTFAVTLETVGTQSITATDSSSGIKSTESNIVVQAAGAKTLAITGLPSSVVAGSSYKIAVTAFDAYGNVATGYTGTVGFSSSDAKAVLPASYTFTASNAGTQTFSVTFETAGTRSITVTDSTSGITAAASNILVQAASANTLAISGLPSSVNVGSAYTMVVTAYDAYGNVATNYTGTVKFTSSDKQAALPSNYSFVASNSGTHTFSVTFETVGTQSITATDSTTASLAGSAAVTVAAGATATLLSTDTSTQGNWIGTYGSQGSDVIGDAAALPSYATVTQSSALSYTWSTSTTDPRALQNPSDRGRIAACWYSGSSFTVDVDLTDGQVHNLDLYLIDWDSTVRNEQVQITNATTGAFLASQVVSSFHSGVYLDWSVSGNILITIANKGPINAVLSGLFFGPTTLNSGPVATATPLGTDTSTQGNWIGTYGSQGSDVIGDAAALPSYATVTQSSALSYTWSTSTTDPRALQNPSGNGRIAACWYSSTGFTVNVDLTDGQAHDLDLYLIDWDSTVRNEQVQITNATTGAFLASAVVSSFHSGVYLDWSVSGNILITFINGGAINAVISGLFFGPAMSNAASVARSPSLHQAVARPTEEIGIDESPATVALGTLDFSGGDTQTIAVANPTSTYAVESRFAARMKNVTSIIVTDSN